MEQSSQLSVWRSICPCDRLFLHGKDGLEAQGNFYMLSSHINLMEQVMREFSGQKNPETICIQRLI
ncbi:MAG: hypothetical protein V8S98_00250 [Lachnospiraceae bacterium]